jgi:hypothetical protein
MVLFAFSHHALCEYLKARIEARSPVGETKEAGRE